MLTVTLALPQVLSLSTWVLVILGKHELMFQAAFPPVRSGALQSFPVHGAGAGNTLLLGGTRVPWDFYQLGRLGFLLGFSLGVWGGGTMQHHHGTPPKVA